MSMCFQSHLAKTKAVGLLFTMTTMIWTHTMFKSTEMSSSLTSENLGSFPVEFYHNVAQLFFTTYSQRSGLPSYNSSWSFCRKREEGEDWKNMFLFRSESKTAGLQRVLHPFFLKQPFLTIKHALLKSVQITVAFTSKWALGGDITTIMEMHV